MSKIQPLADSMLAAAAAVLGRLVDHPIEASNSRRTDHPESIHIDDDHLVAVCTVPALDIRLVARLQTADVAAIVRVMLGETEDSGDLGAMQLSIVSETVSQIGSAMAEQLTRDLQVSSDGITAALCTDAANVPPPPFESYEGTIAVGSEVQVSVTIDFDGIAAAKIAASKPAASKPAAKAPPAKRPAQNAQPVAFPAMAPPPNRGALGARANLDLVHDVPMQISAVLGKTGLTLRDVVGLAPGSVFELDKLSTDPVDLYVNNILIARGEVVVVDDKFAVKISELNSSAA